MAALAPPTLAWTAGAALPEISLAGTGHTYGWGAVFHLLEGGYGSRGILRQPSVPSPPFIYAIVSMSVTDSRTFML